VDIITALQSLVPGVITGGSAAGTTFLGVFQAIRTRISKLEKLLGDAETEPPTGVFYTLDTLSKSVRALRNEVDSWRDAPPDWLIRIVSRTANRGSMTGEHWSEFEQRIEQRMNSFKSSLQRLEDDLDERERRLHDEIGRSSPDIPGVIMRDEYDKDSKDRAEELRRIRESLKSANSFLRGVMAAMGYVDPETNATPMPDTPSTPPPPRPPRPDPPRRMPPLNIPKFPPIPPKKK
jgi:hypothetical protein